ncbi:hypothetical protein D9M68_586760 [compost metagenome]
MVYRNGNRTGAATHCGERILLLPGAGLQKRCGKTNSVSAPEEKDICRSCTSGLQALFYTVAGPVYGLFIQPLRTSAAE